MEDASRYGRLEIDDSRLLSGFAEKRPGGGLINAGLYFFKRRLLERFPPHVPLSMETEVFPGLLAAGARLAVFHCQAPFLDIGTPDTVRRAEAFIESFFHQETQS
jgi:D-glycero-alpha-D-manno-heptose 1-phosphate guanylyltransferase